MKDYGKIHQLEVGTWMVSVGLNLKDTLFPHIAGGMRGRRIIVASLEVRNYLTMIIITTVLVLVSTMDDVQT